MLGDYMKYHYYLITIIMSVLILGCSTSHEIKYYSIDSLSALSVSDSKEPETIYLKRLSIPEFLDSTNLVYRKSKYEWIQTNNHKWISPLKDILKISLKKQFTNNGYILLDVKCPSELNCGELSIQIKDFSGSFNSESTVDFDWIYSKDNKICYGNVAKVVNFKENSYESMIDALNEAWQDVNFKLISEIKTCKK